MTKYKFRVKLTEEKVVLILFVVNWILSMQ